MRFFEPVFLSSKYNRKLLFEGHAVSILILHLSDIHISSADDPVLARAADIAKCTFNSLPNASRVVVVVSGDIAFSGSAQQYTLATKFLNEVKNGISGETQAQIDVLVVPGNHDCNFEADNSVRQVVIKELIESSKLAVDDNVLSTCTVVQREYFDFEKSISGSPTEGDALWKTYEFEVESKKISFDCLNVSWVSKKREDQGGLFFPHGRYESKADRANELRVLVMHHPLNWFNQGAYRPFRSFIRKAAHIILTGHEHTGNVGINLDSESGESAYVEGCVLQNGKSLTESSFNLIEIDVHSGTFKSVRYLWNKAMYLPTDEGSWFDYRALPIKRHNPFEIHPDFRSVMDDPGAYFHHPSGLRLSLSDIFVFPDVLEVDRATDMRTVTNSTAFRDPERTKCGALLQSEEKLGSTSLLLRIFDEYHERGFVPLFVRGAEIRKRTAREVDATLKKCVLEQYGESAVERFNQLASSKKLLLLDDFDDCPLKAEAARSEVIEILKQRFDHMLVTVSDLFEVKELLDGSGSAVLQKFKHYKLLPFGYSLRGRLIRRWFDIGNDGTQDQSVLIAKWDNAEKLVEAVMQRNIIPSAPLFLLTLLQSADSSRVGEFKDSALGFYYQYLITEGFTSAGIPADRLSEPFEFSTKLAWFFHTRNSHELSAAQMREFNDFYSAKYHPGDFQQRMDMLVKARVLNRKGDFYSFRYMYAYYFLKGRYLSQNLKDLSQQAYVKNCCKHLYVRENANTILFLAHFTSDDFVVDAIVESLRGIFQESKPIKFDEDTRAISAFIENAPKLEYTGEKPEVHREKVNQLRDELDDGDDGLQDAEEIGDLSIVAQITVLYKTLDILGQILKNQYANIERTRKVALISEIFSGPLRALSSFYQFIEKYPHFMISEIDAALQKRRVSDVEVRQRIARRIVGRIVEAITFDFITKAGGAVSGEALAHDVQTAISQDGTLAFELIGNALSLDSPAAVSKAQLRKLVSKTKTNTVAARVLLIQVIHHLYMFKTSESDKQWLASEDGLGLDITHQHAIEFNSANKKKSL